MSKNGYTMIPLLIRFHTTLNRMGNSNNYSSVHCWNRYPTKVTTKIHLWVTSSTFNQMGNYSLGMGMNDLRKYSVFMVRYL